MAVVPGPTSAVHCLGRRQSQGLPSGNIGQCATALLAITQPRQPGSRKLLIGKGGPWFESHPLRHFRINNLQRIAPVRGQKGAMLPWH
jgi:hypothetical protein